MRMATWNPIRELEQLHREIDRLFTDDAQGWSLPFSRYSFLPGRSARSYPLVNVREDATAFHVDALAPGIAPESLKVSVVNNQLVIEGDKQAEQDDVKPEAYHRSERATGRFVRTLTLPVEIDAGSVNAEYRNGLLTVTLPKSPSARPRQIAVSVN